jgi:thiol-disulfide isomerase/thioredoxin
MKTLVKTVTLAVLLSGVAQAALAAEGIAGRWDAALTNNGPEVPFRLDITGTGSDIKGVFYDGARPSETTTSASFRDGKLTLKSEHYLTTINATLKDGALVGDTTLQGPGYGIQYGFRAVRHVEAPRTAQNVPAIAGSWVIPLDTPSSKGEKAFRFVAEQNGDEASASILRIDGDTGSYSGSYKDGKWLLSHFDGHRPGVIEVAANTDGTLSVIAHNEALVHALQGNDSKGYGEEKYGAAAPHYLAYKPEVAQARGLPQPDNFLTHTVARDPSEAFKFSFRDVNGRQVSQDDFKGKVVLAVVTGTWCPNCHDEAKYLVQLDKQYRDKGLSIVALDFEEPEQLASLQRARAFIKQYGVKYPYLIAGAPAEMWEKVPQLAHLDTWPATVFVGRDGKVRAVHSGFASEASGEFHTQLKADFTTRIEQLLAEKQTADAAAPARFAVNTPVQHLSDAWTRQP